MWHSFHEYARCAFRAAARITECTQIEFWKFYNAISSLMRSFPNLATHKAELIRVKQPTEGRVSRLRRQKRLPLSSHTQWHNSALRVLVHPNMFGGMDFCKQVFSLQSSHRSAWQINAGFFFPSNVRVFAHLKCGFAAVPFEFFAVLVFKWMIRVKLKVRLTQKQSNSRLFKSFIENRWDKEIRAT